MVREESKMKDVRIATKSARASFENKTKVKRIQCVAANAFAQYFQRFWFCMVIILFLCMHYWFDCCLINALTMMIQNDTFVLIIPAFESPVFDTQSIG